ncbi:MAG: endolytic transglycosylase MltG [Pseudomonadota bacterium]
MALLRLLTGAALAAALTSAAAAAWLYGQLRAPLRVDADAAVLVVERGETVSRVAEKLRASGYLRHSLPLRIYVRWSGRARIHAGEYRLIPGQSVLDLLGRLERGDVIRYRITFPEGWTLAQWRQALAGELRLRAVSREWSAARLAGELGIAQANPEGWFSPNTYSFVAGDSDRDLLARAHRRQTEILAALWRQRAAGLPYAEPYEALILASLVERETGLAAERPQIAGVFVRRLQSGMRLETDPSVIYGLGDRYQGNLTREHLRERNDYNTYVIDRLPPTPIANPGDDALRAALMPAAGDALYFVARGDGSHEFSATLEQHLRAVRRYQLQRRPDYRSSPQPGAGAP